MTDYVTFTLVAPMGAFGELAGHTQRSSWRWPGRSAVLGLIGAALGVRRDDTAGQQGLQAWKMAVSALSLGPALQDFHTVQTVPTARAKRPPTRRAALAALKPSDNGLITRREYRMDCAFGVALWGGSAPETVVNALKNPCFAPYLGRKSCPLSAQMAPAITPAETPAQALTQVTLPPFMALTPSAPAFIASDEAPSCAARVETRFDIPLDREKWHFSGRQVHIYQPERGEG